MSEMVPRLRFKEFRESWRETKLGNLAEPPRYGLGLAATKFDGVHKYLRITDIDEDSRRFQPNPLVSPEGNFDDAYKLKFGDIVFARTGASVGKTYLYREEDGALYFAGFLILFRIINADSYFIFNQTLTVDYSKWIQRTSMRSGQPGVNAQEYSSLKLIIPDISEQQKIALFLNSVDEKIRLLERKVSLLQTYKCGVMQKLFSQEVRFKREDGSAFPDWEFKLFGIIFDFYRTNSLSRSQLSYEVGNTQNIHYGDIHTKFSARFHQEHEVIPYINESETTYSCSVDDYCKVGDLVIADASEDYKDIGKAIEIVSTTETPLVAGLHTFLARPKNSTFALGFTGYMMQSESIREEIMRLAQGISVLGISKKQLSKIVVPMPCFEEQQKIASFFSTIDAKIDAVSTQISQMQRFKKGLLQQMFV